MITFTTENSLILLVFYQHTFKLMPFDIIFILCYTYGSLINKQRHFMNYLETAKQITFGEAQPIPDEFISIKDFFKARNTKIKTRIYSRIKEGKVRWCFCNMARLYHVHDLTLAMDIKMKEQYAAIKITRQLATHQIKVTQNSLALLKLYKAQEGLATYSDVLELLLPDLLD
jgi:hypothetical protein